MPKLNTANPEEGLSLEGGGILLKSLILMLRLTWPMKSIINSGDFRKAVLAKKPGLYILGKSGLSQPWLNGDEFHAVMNYPLWKYQGLFPCVGIRRRNASFGINSQSMQLRQQISKWYQPLGLVWYRARILTTAKGDSSPSSPPRLPLSATPGGTPCTPLWKRSLALIRIAAVSCLWERVCGQWYADLWRTWSLLRKEVAGIIQHGQGWLRSWARCSSSRMAAWRQPSKEPTFNHSKKDFVFRKRTSRSDQSGEHFRVLSIDYSAKWLCYL